MTTIADPIIGSWYKDLENNLKFKVINIEDDNDSIEVQYLNGDIGEYDQESWYGSTFDYIEDPEDWSAPFDEIEDDDKNNKFHCYIVLSADHVMDLDLAIG